MKAFAALYRNLDETTKTNAKIKALVDYFNSVPPADAVWTVRFLTGRRPKRPLRTALLKQWAAEQAAIKQWLFEESYHIVGDLAETISLLLPPSKNASELALHHWVEEVLLPLATLDEEKQKEVILESWRQMNTEQRFVWNKLLTGGFRVGVSQRLVTRALAEYGNIDAAVIAHRLMGEWQPKPAFWEELFAAESAETDKSKPYPFYLAYPLEDKTSMPGPVAEWQVEWKYDGIRAQLIKRAGDVFLWSRGEELVGHTFPELTDAGTTLPDGTVLDGEIVVWRDQRVQTFGALQKRLGRKKPGKKVLLEAPVALICFDLLECDGRDIRRLPLNERRSLLEKTVNSDTSKKLIVAPKVEQKSWEEIEKLLDEARARGVEGFMLKRLASAYGVGRKSGDWWKWKVQPYTIDAVLIYAQRGHGRRANLYTDYTFAVHDGGQLVPFAKAYSGLTDKEIREVDRFIKNNTRERFGPVRTVEPELVFEIAFEAIRESSRHKSGVAVRFPRISRWRRDKKPSAANTLEDVKKLLPKL